MTEAQSGNSKERQYAEYYRGIGFHKTHKGYWVFDNLPPLSSGLRRWYDVFTLEEHAILENDSCYPLEVQASTMRKAIDSVVGPITTESDRKYTRDLPGEKAALYVELIGKVTPEKPKNPEAPNVTVEDRLYNMGMHETLKIRPGLNATRVPGGWLYESLAYQGGLFKTVASEFVKYYDRHGSIA